MMSVMVDRAGLARRGRHLQVMTIAWNSGEFLVGVGAGVVSGSIALIGFGFDSAIEVASSLMALWRLRFEFCAYLSAILLAGLGLNAWLGWWWADSLAALVMVPLIAREGWAALRGDSCCASGHDVHCAHTP